MSEIKSILESLGYRLKDNGKTWHANAAFRNGDNYQALIIDKDGSGFHDFVSPENSGSFKKLIALTLGKSYKEVDRYLKNKKYEEVSHEREEPDLSETYAPIFPPDYLGKIIPDHSYWVNRGIPEKIIKHFRGGIIKGESRMKHRYVLPIFARNGVDVNGFAGRYLYPIPEDKKKQIQKWKCLSPKKFWEYPLFLTEKYIKETREIVILESFGDILACAAGGLKQTFAPIGISSFSKITSLCIEFDPKRIIIAFNNDQRTQAGNKAALNLQKCLLNFFNKDKIKVAWPTKYGDFGEASEKGDLDYIKEWYSEIK